VCDSHAAYVRQTQTVARTMTPVVYTMYGFAVLFLVYWSALWVVHILALVYGKWRLHRKLNTPCLESAGPDLEGVSIIKPLNQSQDTLLENLETFFTLKYPKYELLFCIQEVDDSVSHSIIKKLIDLYPKVDAKIFRGGEDVGVNPKINNMSPAYKAAKHPLIMVSDAGIKMKEDTLLDMALCMKDNVGLVHQMPFSCDRTGLPAILEKVYFGTGHARIYLSANLLGINCATGMSALMRKSLLDSAGGFPAFGCYLAEDYFFAKHIQDSGYQVVISSQPAWQNPGNSSITYFQNRISRWTKLRTAMCPHTILLEPTSECMVAGGLAAWAAYVICRIDPLVFYLIHVLCWFLSDWTLIHIVQNGSLPFNKFEFMVMWLFRELGAPYIFMHALCNPAIRWRNLEFRLRWGGRAEAIQVKAARASSAPVPASSLPCSPTASTLSSTLSSSCVAPPAVSSSAAMLLSKQQTITDYAGSMSGSSGGFGDGMTKKCRDLRGNSGSGVGDYGDYGSGVGDYTSKQCGYSNHSDLTGCAGHHHNHYNHQNHHHQLPTLTIQL